jgi:ABC-type antimicrobial peptide transport system permease subunit
LLNRTILQERTVATLSAALGVLGVTLACVGFYGLLAYRGVRRTGEIGVRMALGATRPGVLWMVLREDFAVVFAGVVIGLPMALAASSLTRSLLFGLTATDRPTLMVTTAAMIVIGASAVRPRDEFERTASGPAGAPARVRVTRCEDLASYL